MTAILIVEDHKEFREAIKKFIIMKGVKADILEAMTAEEAMGIASSHRPKVVIIDIHLTKGVSGLELASSIKAKDPSCSIILLTMYTNQDMKHLCKTKDVEDFIDKSDLDVRLVPAINRLLALERA
ncbi:MAG: response regulator [Candidatus Omnitrophica bacterium]|nr:response regulator [Candidatus Omnitrophota bacterium]